VFPLAPSLDHVGPMARSVDDVARIFAVLAGRDPRDPATRAATSIDAAIAPFPRGLRVGFDPVTCADGVDPRIRDAVVRVVDALDASGARIQEVEMPPIGDALAAWLPICASEAATAHAATYPARKADYGPDLAGLLETGLSASGRDVAGAWQHRIAHTRALAAIFDLCDVLVCPALAVALAAGVNLGAAPPPAGAFTAMRFTLPFDLSGDPCLTLPCGLDNDGAPIGVQLVGPALTELRLLAIAAHLEARGLGDIGHPKLPLT
jgi:amidase